MLVQGDLVIAMSVYKRIKPIVSPGTTYNQTHTLYHMYIVKLQYKMCLYYYYYYYDNDRIDMIKY